MDADFDEWLAQGQEKGWVSTLWCGAHEMPPMTQPEKEDLSTGIDRCMPSVRALVDRSARATSHLRISRTASQDWPLRVKTLATICAGNELGALEPGQRFVVEVPNEALVAAGITAGGLADQLESLISESMDLQLDPGSIVFTMTRRV